MSSAQSVEVTPITQCLECTRKHLSTAISLYEEFKTGYKSNEPFIIGELVLTEWHVRIINNSLADEVRDERLRFMRGEGIDLISLYSKIKK